MLNFWSGLKKTLKLTQTSLPTWQNMKVPRWNPLLSAESEAMDTINNNISTNKDFLENIFMVELKLIDFN